MKGAIFGELSEILSIERDASIRAKNHCSGKACGGERR